MIGSILGAFAVAAAACVVLPLAGIPPASAAITASNVVTALVFAVIH
jgi:hypothetical protein